VTILPWCELQPDGSVVIDIDAALYSADVIMRTCYAFTDRSYVFASQDDSRIRVTIAARDPSDDLRKIAGDFSNALIDFRLRATIAGETHAIRELIVAQAFCEADLLDRRDSESDYHTDPRGIATSR